MTLKGLVGYHVHTKCLLPGFLSNLCYKRGSHQWEVEFLHSLLAFVFQIKLPARCDHVLKVARALEKLTRITGNQRFFAELGLAERVLVLVFLFEGTNDLVALNGYTNLSDRGTVFGHERHALVRVHGERTARVRSGFFDAERSQDQGQRYQVFDGEIHFVLFVSELVLKLAFLFFVLRDCETKWSLLFGNHQARSFGFFFLAIAKPGHYDVGIIIDLESN